MKAGTYVSQVGAVAVSLIFLIVFFHIMGVTFRPAPSSKVEREVVIESLIGQRLCASHSVEPTKKDAVCMAHTTKDECLGIACCGWAEHKAGGKCVYGPSGSYPHFPQHGVDMHNFVSAGN